MGKPKGSKGQPQQQPKKGKKKPQISKMNSEDEEEVDDVMAWGRKRQNYYREDESEYSSLSEQQKQAQQIYKNKFDYYLNDEDVYDIPAEKAQTGQQNKRFDNQLEDPAQQEETLPEEYVGQQLEWVLELFKDLQFYQNNDLLTVYEKLLKSYLTAIVSIKELKIPYIQYHPIIPLAVQIKTKIIQLMKKLTIKQEEDKKTNKNKNTKRKLEEQSLDENEEDEDQLDSDGLFDQQNDQSMEQQAQDDIQQDSYAQQWSESGQSPKNKKQNKLDYPDHCAQAIKAQTQQHKKGLDFYNKMKQNLEEQKKKKKQQKREERKQNQKPAFKQVGENQGRFASQLILKNKGLIKKRKKIQGNSRLKLRKKYQKRKSIHRARTGHFIRENPGRAYQGESNIRTGKIAGVRLK